MYAENRRIEQGNEPLGNEYGEVEFAGAFVIPAGGVNVLAVVEVSGSEEATVRVQRKVAALGGQKALIATASGGPGVVIVQGSTESAEGDEIVLEVESDDPEARLGLCTELVAYKND